MSGHARRCTGDHPICVMALNRLMRFVAKSGGSSLGTLPSKSVSCQRASLLAALGAIRFTCNILRQLSSGFRDGATEYSGALRFINLTRGRRYSAWRNGERSPHVAKRLDQVIVVDVEATCWEGEPPPGEESEIIEIGVCPLEISTGRRLEKRSILVRPERSHVSTFCTSLTTLTSEQVTRGISFAEACAILRKEYLTRERPWASFGDYDRNQFDRQCRATGVPYPFGGRHLNVKTLFGLVRRLAVEIDAAAAVALLG